MVANFMQRKQTFSELKMMIEQTLKKGNQEFGQDIVQAALEVRDKRDLKKGKKDYLSSH